MATNDEKRLAFGEWLALQLPAKGVKSTAATRARRDAMDDLAKLVGRKHWEHVPQCFAALRFDFGRSPGDAYARTYGEALADAEYQHQFIETGRAPVPALTITEGDR